MAFVDPKLATIVKAPSTTQVYQLKIHDINPFDIEPNGDRYVVEEIAIDESKVVFGKIMVLTQAPEKIDPRDPHKDPTVEVRGIIAGVVVAKGNGHLLGLPDPRVAVANEWEATGASGGDKVERHAADVPMFYDIGDVVFIDHNAKGRALQILGRTCRVVNQIDILARVPKLKLKFGENGWEEDAPND